MEPRSKNVLIVDDEESVRNLLLTYTQDSDLGLNAMTAESVQEAIVKSAQVKYDLGLVILDGLGGKCFQIAEVIRENNPLAKIILWSTNGDVLDRLPHPFIDGTLPKPILMGEYMDLLRLLYPPQDNPAP